MGLLEPAVVERELGEIGGWRVEGAALARDFSFADFAEAMAFVNEVAALAEAANHHPDINIRYDKVAVWSSSHDVGGITRRDLRLALAINAIQPHKI